VLAKQGDRRCGMAVHATAVLRPGAQARAFRSATVSAPPIGPMISRISSPSIRFCSQLAADSTRDSQSSRITRKSLKTLARAPFYPRRPGASNFAGPRMPCPAPNSLLRVSTALRIASKISADLGKMNVSQEASCCA
jgi:hypothetical protein